MTYAEVTATGAEIVRDAFTTIPEGGWNELTLEGLRQLHVDIAKRLERLANGTSADAYQEVLTKNR